MTPDEVEKVNIAIGILINMLIAFIAKTIPFVGTILHLPIIGWIANMVINSTLGILYKWLDNLILDKKVDDAVKVDIDAAKKALDAVKSSSPKDPNHAQTVEDAATAIAKLRHLDVVQS